MSLSPLAFRRDTVTSTDSSSMRKKWEDFYVPTSRLGFAFSEMAGSRDVIGIIIFSPTSILFGDSNMKLVAPSVFLVTL